MPNWKKVIVSGSNAILNHITASGNVSGSAISTASFGTYIGDGSQLSGISTTPFPFTGDAQISGSLIVSQSYTVGDTNSTALRLFGSGSVSQSGIFEVEGSAGPLFSVQDGLDGILMEVNNISGLPLFQVSSSNEVFINRGNLTSGVNTATASFANFSGSFQGDGTNLNLASNTTIPSSDPFPFTGDAQITGSLIISASHTSQSLSVIGSGSTVFNVIGSEGDLFTITDNLTTGSLFAVKDINGFPLLDVTANSTTPDTVTVGQSNLILDSGSLQVTGSTGISGSLQIQGIADVSASIAAASTPTTAGSTAGRVVFTATNGELTTESGFEYNSTTDQLKVHSLDVVHLTSSFITASTVQTSGSNIFGDDTTDTQTLIGTTKMSGSAQITGSLTGTPGTTNNLTASYAITASHALSSLTATTATTASFALTSSLVIQQDAVDKVVNTRNINFTGNAVSLITGAPNPGASVIVAINTGSAVEAFPFTGDAQITGSLIISASHTSQSLSVIGSGSTVFNVIGSEGTLFSIDDDLDGIIFTANDRSGLPVLEASASGEVYIGKAPQSLYTTAVISSTTANISQSIYGLSTGSYGGVFVDYTANSGSNARAGSIVSVWNGSSINFTETTTLDIGDTSNLLMQVAISQSQAQVQSYATTAGYNIKTIIRSI